MRSWRTMVEISGARRAMFIGSAGESSHYSGHWVENYLTHRFCQTLPLILWYKLSNSLQRLALGHFPAQAVLVPIYNHIIKNASKNVKFSLLFPAPPADRIRRLYISPCMMQSKLFPVQGSESIGHVRKAPIVIVKSHPILTGTRIRWLTLTTRGIIPGSALVPCIVCVLPEDVTP